LKGKSDLPGKPVLYGTSKKFMDYFGINNISQLPDLKELAEAGNSIGMGQEV
jgi:segregation and condensation protein B